MPAKTLPGVGVLINETLKTFKKHQNLFLWLGGAYGLITLALSSLMTNQIETIMSHLYLKPDNFVAGIATSGLAVFIIPIIIFIIGTYIYVVITKVALSDKKIELLDSLKIGAAIVLSALWLQIVSGLIVWAGFIYLIIPGIYFAIAVIFIIQVLLDQKLTGIEALIKSKDMIQGYWWAVFGRLILLGILMMIVNMILMIIPGAVSFVSEQAGIISAYLVNFVFMAVSILFSSIFYTKLYKHLLVIKGSSKPKDLDDRRKKYIIVTAIAYILPVAILLIKLLSSN